MQRFERIYAEHVDAVRAYVRRRAPQAVVEDVVADVFVVALRRIDDVPRNALPWLYAVARKTLANERRKRAHEQFDCTAIELQAVEPEPVGDLQLAAAFAALSDADREILRLVAWEGLPFRDVARVLEVSPVAARVRFHRAKTRLAAALDAPASFRPEIRGATQ